jgi:hypothetical protein
VDVTDLRLGSNWHWVRYPDEGGLRWADRNAGGERQPVLVAPTEARQEMARPLNEDAALFVNFAHVPATPDGILAFARRHGLLYADARRPEWFGTWRDGIRLMEDLIGFWNAIRDGDAEWMAEELHVDQESLGPERLIELSRNRLAAEVKKLIYFDAHLIPSWQDEHRCTIALDFDSLMAAMAWQFLQAVAGDKHFKSCRVCGTWYEVRAGRGQGARRADRDTCSDACRVRAYRERQTQARQMHAKGKTFRQIAAALGSDVPTVKGWVTGNKP